MLGFVTDEVLDDENFDIEPLLQVITTVHVILKLVINQACLR